MIKSLGFEVFCGKNNTQTLGIKEKKNGKLVEKIASPFVVIARRSIAAKHIANQRI
jgi:hypothetical protein